jgi:hypothetical protein
MTQYDYGRVQGREDVLNLLDPTERLWIMRLMAPVVPDFTCTRCKDTGWFYDGFEMSPCHCEVKVK